MQTSSKKPFNANTTPSASGGSAASQGSGRRRALFPVPQRDLGAHAEVFTGAFLDGGYGPPPGFDFDGPPAPARGPT